MAVKKQSFEQNMNRLEEIVLALERGECDLDESLKRFDIVYPACGSSNSAVELSLAELEGLSGCLECL